MKVEKVVPCVCARQAILKDEFSDEGMPQLIVRNGLSPHKQFWSAFCPKCGRGSKLDDYKSAYLALKNWNRFQNSLWDIEEKGPGWFVRRVKGGGTSCQRSSGSIRHVIPAEKS